VDDTSFVKIGEALGHFAHEISRLLLAEPLRVFAKNISQRRPCDVLHDDEGRAITGDPDIEDEGAREG